MITVTIDPASGFMQMTGHAGYGPKGQDIVCAGASMLAQTLAAQVQHTGGVERLEIGPGRMLLRARNIGYIPYFEMAKTGFGLLADRYPDHVKVI